MSKTTVFKKHGPVEPWFGIFEPWWVAYDRDQQGFRAYRSFRTWAAAIRFASTKRCLHR